MKKKIFIAAAVIFSSQLYAQDSTKKTLDEVVVTANKYPQKQSSTGKVLTVISRDELDKNSGRTLAQVLNDQAGLNINGSQNALGTNQTVYLRGAAEANTLILVDGVPANDASGISGQFDITHFSIDQIERVEILKGAQSVLYGSDAVAGVINIITRKQSSNKKAGLNATLAGGSYGTIKGDFGISGVADAFTYNLQYSKLKSDGFSAAQDVTGKNNFDRDGFNQDAVGLNVTAKAAKNWQLRLFGKYAKYKADIDDGAFTDDKNKTIKNKNVQLGINSVTQFSKGSFTVNLNLNNIERNLNDEKNIPADPNDFDPFHGVYKGKSLFAEAYTNLNVTKHIGFLAGADVRNQKADIETTYGNLGADSLKATQVSGYASLHVQSIGGFNAELGSRYTHHSTFGSAFTYSFNPSYIINQQVKLFANIATGFRAPSLYNLASEYGNNNLKPEKSNSYEGGIQFFNKQNTANVRFTYFNRHIKDVIIFKSIAVSPYGQYVNADKQDDNGFELEVILHPTDKLRITANYAFVNGHIKSLSANTGKDTSIYNLYRRPKNTFNAGFAWQASKKLTTSIGLKWMDKRDDLFFNPVTYATERVQLKSYYTINIYTSYQVNNKIKFFADLQNVTDQKYFDIYGYNSRRFNLIAGVSVTF